MAQSLPAATCWKSSHPTVTLVLCSLPPCSGTHMSPTFSPVAIDFLHKVPRGPVPKAYLLLSRTSCSPRMFFPAPLSERSSLAIALALWWQLDLAQRRWGRHLLGWASGTPCASVLYEFALPDSICLSTGRALSLVWPSPFAHCRRVLRSCFAVFALSQNTPGTWAHWCLSLLQHHAAGNPADFGVGPRCSSAVTRRWSCTALSIPCWTERGFIVSVAASPSSLVSASTLELSVPSRWTFWSTIPLFDLGLARWWGLARHGS